MTDLPKSAKTTVVGGGIIGCSVAYHLAKRGMEVLLLERHQLTSGSTWHAAGLVGQLRTNANITRLLGYSVELYQKLADELWRSAHKGRDAVRILRAVLNRSGIRRVVPASRVGNRRAQPQ